MSRIGKQPIPLPKGVEVKITESNFVSVKGPKGQLEDQLPGDMIIKQEDGTLLVQRPSDQRKHRELHGLTRSLLANMVTGVTDGFQRVLELNGVGYRARREGNTLILQIGFSHPVNIDPPEGITFEVPERRSANDPQQVIVSGIHKQMVGEQAAKIRQLRRPEPYKGYGIKYKEERIRRKAGKAGKTK